MSRPVPPPRLPGAVLAVDAGNSKTDVALVGPDGAVLGLARGGGYRPMGEDGARGAVAGLAPLVREAAARAGCAPADGSASGQRTGPLVEHVAAYLANADLPVEEEEAARLISARGWGRSTVVGNDTLALLRSGTDRPEGVAVVCGAGINAVGLRADGATARFLSVGRVSGDWGGGGSLSEELMFAAVRGEDGRGPRTALSRRAAAYFGTPTATAAAEALHLGRVSRSRLWRITPVLFEAAEAGDAVAVGLVRRQADEVVAMAHSCLRRLELLEHRVVVVLGGGVLAARHPLLLDGVTAGLAERAPRAVPRIAAAAPVVGAALLGLDHLAARSGGDGGGCGPAVESRLRASYAAAREGAVPAGGPPSAPATADRCRCGVEGCAP